MANDFSAPAGQHHKALQGAILMVVAMFVLSGMDVLAKLVVEADYHPAQLLAIRGWIVILLFCLWLPKLGGLEALKTTRPVLMWTRGLIGFSAPFCFFLALRDVSLPDAVTVFFASPIMMTAFSVILLRERVGLYRWSAVLVGFVGVAIAMQPGANSFQSAMLLVLVATAGYSLLSVIGRMLSDTESTFRLVFYFNAGVTIVATLIAPFVWKSLTLEALAGIGLIAVLAIIGHICLTLSFSSAPIGVVAPFEYSALIWAALAGYLVWGDQPAWHMWLGAAIITASGIFIAYREQAQQKTNPPPEGA